MRMTFKIRYEDGREVEAVAKPKDIVAFERQYGVSLQDFTGRQVQTKDGEQFVREAPMEWMFYLAWSPLHRQGREPRAFDEFLDDVDNVEEVEEEEPVPFDLAASDEPSPPSLSAPASAPAS